MKEINIEREVQSDWRHGPYGRGMSGIEAGKPTIEADSPSIWNICVLQGIARGLSPAGRAAVQCTDSGERVMGTGTVHRVQVEAVRGHPPWITVRHRMMLYGRHGPDEYRIRDGMMLYGRHGPQYRIRDGTAGYSRHGPECCARSGTTVLPRSKGMANRFQMTGENPNGNGMHQRKDKNAEKHKMK